jgi:hypothetical protein
MTGDEESRDLFMAESVVNLWINDPLRKDSTLRLQ